jgi:hypothetical protein
MDYKEVIDKLVRELSYRVGIPNIENKEHQSIMSEILSEWGEYDVKQTIFEFLTEKDGEEDSSEDKKFTNTGGSGYVKAQDYTKWKSDPKGFDGPKFTKTPSGKYIPQKDGEGEEGGEEEKELGKSLKDKSYQQKVKKEKEISDKIQKEKEGKSSSDSEEKTDNEKSFDELKKDIANNPDIIKDLKSFEKFLDNKQKEALKLEGKKRVKELEKLDSLSESFDNLPDDVKNTTSSIFAKGQIFEGRQNSGIGKNRLGYLDVKTLASNKEYLMKSYGDGSAEAVKEFVQQSRKIKVNEDYVKSSFDLLPVSLQKSLQGKGKVGDAGKNKHFLGYVRNDGEITSDKNDPNIKKGEDGKLEVKRGNPGGKDRGRFVWRAILEQGGQDPYTGLPLDLSAIDLEHTVAFDNKDNGTPSAQDYLDREHDDNIIICATNINQKKSNLSMKEFYERIVDGQIGKSEEEFTKESETYETINNVASQTEQKAALILEGGKIKKGYDFKILKQTFDGDDDTYTNARDEFRKVAKTKEDKKALAKLKSGIGKNTLMAMGLGRGLTDKSGRRTIKLSSDNLYRGFLLSMADEPDRQDEYKKAWEEARKVGNSDEYRLKGKGQQGMIKYLIDKKFISHKVLSDKKMGKVFQNSLTEVFDYDLNEYIILN